MLFFWLFILAAMVVCDRLSKLSTETVLDEHKFKLYALRDELREAALDKRIDPKVWLFQYIDSSIAKTISALHTWTIWRLIGFVVTEPDERVRIAIQKLDSELQKPENQVLQAVYYKWVSLTIEAAMERNPKTWGFLQLMEGWARKYHERWKRAERYPTVFRDTSTLSNYQQAA